MTVIRPGPPKPCIDVEKLLESSNVGSKELLHLYKVFHKLAQCTKDGNQLNINARSIQTEQLINLVHDRREWIEVILLNLLQLGNIRDEMSWDEFLYMTLNYCALSKVELAQTMFYIITKQIKSWTSHFVTSMQLQEFYDHYRDCPHASFCTKDISFFGHLALTRYYVSDFVELTHRFSELINPAIHLQRALQQKLPTMSFWNDYDRVEVQNRQITLDFFNLRKTHVFLRVNATFRESCDMLMPDALGGSITNEDQWKLRAPHYNTNQGVWPKHFPHPPQPQVVAAEPPRIGAPTTNIEVDDMGKRRKKKTETEIAETRRKMGRQIMTQQNQHVVDQSKGGPQFQHTLSPRDGIAAPPGVPTDLYPASPTNQPGQPSNLYAAAQSMQGTAPGQPLTQPPGYPSIESLPGVVQGKRNEEKVPDHLWSMDLNPDIIADQLKNTMGVRNKPMTDTADISTVPDWVREYATIPVKRSAAERLQEATFISANRNVLIKPRSQVDVLNRYMPQELLTRPIINGFEKKEKKLR